MAAHNQIPILRGNQGDCCKTWSRFAATGVDQTGPTLLLAAGLTRHANGHFKLGCVLQGRAATVHFDAADERTDECRWLLEPLPPTAQLAEAILVAGVTTSCRGHQLKRAERANWELVRLHSFTSRYQCG